MTLLLGVPVNSKTKSAPAVQDAFESFLRLYGSASSEPLAEIRMGAFDYSCLGEKKGLSSTANFRTLAEYLRALFPDAFFDNRLTRAPRTSPFPLTPQAALEQNASLVYLFYAAAPPAPSSLPGN